MRFFVRLVLFALVLALVAGLPASAARAPTFTSPVPHGFEHGDDWEPAIAADRFGHVYAAWSHYVGYAGADTGDPDPSSPTCASPHTVLQVSNDGGTTWSEPRAMSPSTQRQDDAQVAVDAADGKTVYATFMQNNKSSEYVARSDERTVERLLPLVGRRRGVLVGGSKALAVRRRLFIQGREPERRFCQPYGDYFELDIDSAGQTQAIWGEGPSYVGPGNVWYARGS